MNYKVDLQIAELLYDMSQYACKDIAKDYLEKIKERYPDAPSFDEYMKLYEKHKMIEMTIMFSQRKTAISAEEYNRRAGKIPDEHLHRVFTI